MKHLSHLISSLLSQGLQPHFKLYAICGNQEWLISRGVKHFLTLLEFEGSPGYVYGNLWFVINEKPDWTTIFGLKACEVNFHSLIAKLRKYFHLWSKCCRHKNAILLICMALQLLVWMYQALQKGRSYNSNEVTGDVLQNPEVKALFCCCLTLSLD